MVLRPADCSGQQNDPDASRSIEVLSATRVRQLGRIRRYLRPPHLWNGLPAGLVQCGPRRSWGTRAERWRYPAVAAAGRPMGEARTVDRPDVAQELRTPDGCPGSSIR